MRTSQLFVQTRALFQFIDQAPSLRIRAAVVCADSTASIVASPCPAFSVSEVFSYTGLGERRRETLIRVKDELPAPPVEPDLGVIATPANTVPGIIAELGAKGARAAVCITGGLSSELKQAMLDAARPYCLRVLGPNGIGLQVPGIGLNASFGHRHARPGDIAFVSQSGALVTAVADWAAERGIGFSHVVSNGDMADVDFGDLLDYLAGDASSHAILIYMEALTNAAKFLSAARRASRVKPVILVKSGLACH